MKTRRKIKKETTNNRKTTEIEKITCWGKNKGNKELLGGRTTRGRESWGTEMVLGGGSVGMGVQKRNLWLLGSRIGEHKRYDLSVKGTKKQPTGGRLNKIGNKGKIRSARSTKRKTHVLIMDTRTRRYRIPEINIRGKGIYERRVK